MTIKELEAWLDKNEASAELWYNKGNNKYHVRIQKHLYSGLGDAPDLETALVYAQIRYLENVLDKTGKVDVELDDIRKLLQSVASLPQS